MPYKPITHALLYTLRWRIRRHGMFASFAIGLTWLAWASIILPLAATALVAEAIVTAWEEAERG
jgi:hypothetical protein